MKKLSSVLLSAALLGLGAITLVQAQTGSTTPQVTFPIAELGSCTSKEACRVYCDIEANHEACFAYAQTHGLMRKEEVEKARNFIKEHRPLATTTPNGELRPPKEASSTIAALLKRILGPGGCTSQEACRVYCADTTHQKVCLEFGVKNHLISGDQASTTQKFEEALKGEGGPGGCKTTQECKTFCSDPTNQQVCMRFAEEHGFNRVKNDIERPMGSSTLRVGSTTAPRPAIKPFATSTRPVPANINSKPDGKLSSSTYKQEEKRNPFAPLPPKGIPPSTSAGQNGQGSNSQGNNVDKMGPPYHCTAAQTMEGACDPDQFPGYHAENEDNQGGAVYEAWQNLLHWMGL